MHRTAIRSVTIIHAVDQVPIEQIEPGDTVLTHLPDGSGVPPSVYRPHARSTTTEPAWSPPSKRRLAR